MPSQPNERAQAQQAIMSDALNFAYYERQAIEKQGDDYDPYAYVYGAVCGDDEGEELDWGWEQE